MLHFRRGVVAVNMTLQKNSNVAVLTDLRSVISYQVSYCEELIKVLDIVLPGLTKERGLLLSQVLILLIYKTV